MLEQTLFSPDIAVIIGLAGLAAVTGRVIGRPAPLMFLLTGLVAGPILGLVGHSETAGILADLGLVFLLFLIGLELKVARIKPLLRDTLWISPVQMIIAFTVFFLLSLLFFDRTTAIVIGIATTYSSTAVVLRMLAERNEVGTTAGRLDMSLLLFEDLTVIIIIAGITAGGASTALMGSVVQAVTALAMIGALAAVCTRVILPALLSQFYDTPHTYFIQAIGILFGFIAVSELLGISHEIGAFFAGIALAQLPGNEEVHERIRPLTELFMALFFLGLSLQLQFSDIASHLGVAAILSVGIFIDKFIAHLGLFHYAGYSLETSFRGAINMTNISEFSLVLGATALGAGLITQDILGLLTVVALVTMMVSTILIDEQDRLYRMFGTLSEPRHTDRDVAVIGFGPNGPDTLTVLETYYDDIVVVDPSLRTSKQLGSEPHEHIFADIEHETIKQEAGFYTAEVIVGIELAPEDGIAILETAPDETTTIMIVADTETADAFRDAGADLVLTLETLSAEHLARVLHTAEPGDHGG